MFKTTIIFIAISLISSTSISSTRDLFKDITRQSHDHFCGPAALSTLIKGKYKNRNVTEQQIVGSATSGASKKQGFDADELAKIANRLGYKAAVHRIAKDQLVKIKEPIILLIGSNTELSHFVVFKGIRNNEAFLADPLRGHIRVPYKKLVKEGLNKKHPEWYVIGIIDDSKLPANSTLRLSENAQERKDNHLTEAQSAMITATSLSKKNQWVISYGFNSSTKRVDDGFILFNSSTFTHSINAQYGITETTELSFGFEYDRVSDTLFDETYSSSLRRYNIAATQLFHLDDAGKFDLLLGGGISYTDLSDTFGGEVNLMLHQKNEYLPFTFGVSISKPFVKNLVSDYQYAYSLSVNKFLGDRLGGSLSFALNNDKLKDRSIKIDPYYTVTAGVTYSVSEHFQIGPSASYSWKGDWEDNISFGITFTYVGSW